MILPERPPQWLRAVAAANPSGQFQQQPFAMLRADSSLAHLAARADDQEDD
jgi:hypothetical protein